GVSSVNVAQTAIYKGRPTLIKTAIVDIDLFNEGQREASTIAAVRKALAGFETRQADIICVLGTRFTITESVVLPIMPEDEIPDAVRLELAQLRHFNLDKPIIDHQIAGTVSEKGVEKMTVVAAAASQSSVDAVLYKFLPPRGRPLVAVDPSVMQEATCGLEVNAIIPLSIAIENVIQKSKFKLNETVAILEIGTLSAELNIYRNSRLEFSRAIPVSGFDFTKSLTEAFFSNAGKVELTLEEAESIKRKYGIPSPTDDFIVYDKITAAQITALLRPKLEQLAGEVSRSFDFYFEKMQTSRIDRLIVFGGGAKMKGLAEFLSVETGIPVHLGNPVQDVEMLFEGVVRDSEEAQKLVQAIGASLGNPNGINLIPEHLRDLKGKTFRRKIMTGVGLLTLFVFSMVYLGLLSEKVREEGALAELKADYSMMLPKVRDLKRDLEVRTLIASRPAWDILFKYLTLLPENVYLKSLVLNQDRVSVAGFVVGNDSGVLTAPVEIAKDLDKGILDRVNLVSKKETTIGTEFQIEGRLGK
ncbi:MAG: pilus assembly protein PilM, partial [Elusimicrobia bacterium]|nr:pilus assembly protein PilM [Elusimicrobiota bacterium]